MPGVLEHLAALADPACYPEGTRSVEILQTHISVVCLTDTRAYKLKKAVQLPFLDTRTLARRLHDCHEEVRLNRRLCPDVYLGVLGLVATPAGLRFVPEPFPELFEPAVVMRRLPKDRMLDHLVERHAIDAGAVRELARRVAHFHASCERGARVTAIGAPSRLAALAHANFTECATLDPDALPRRLLAALAAVTRADFARILPLLEARAAAGRIVDGHGDLHTRNICMTQPPAIYDCIEFEPAFRCADVATEIAFLLMDLRYRGAPDLAEAFLASYESESGDAGLRTLVPPLVRYRALVRSKVAAITSAEREIPAADREGARGAARRHLRLAAVTALEEARKPWWIVCGPPASGKTTLCHELAHASSWEHLSTDVVRKELHGVPATQRAPASAYSAAATAATYAEVLRRARASRAGGVLLDGNFATPELRAQAREAARASGAAALVVACEVDPAEAARRAATRALDPANTSDAGLAELPALIARYVPPHAREGDLLVAGSGTPAGSRCDEVLAAALERDALRSRVP